MIESFVDLTYRDLALGRRIKLTQVRPTTGYLELPMPMPVGTQIAITTDEGVTLEATVTQIHEQVGGSDRVPGMLVKPVLTAEAAQAWWQARVALPEDAEPAPRSRPITVRPRSHTVPQPPAAPPTPPAPPPVATEQPVAQVQEAQPLTTEVTATKELSVYVPEPAAPAPAAAPVEVPAYEVPARKHKEEDAARTTVMPAVDQELLAKLTSADGEVEHLVRRTGEHEVVDDGLRTTVMDAVDPAALGLDVSASGSMPAAAAASDDDDDDGGDKPSTKPATGKKRKKRR